MQQGDGLLTFHTRAAFCRTVINNYDAVDPTIILAIFYCVARWHNNMQRLYNVVSLVFRLPKALILHATLKSWNRAWEQSYTINSDIGI